MVSVAQLVEPRIVIPVVVGSIPIAHPNFCNASLRTMIVATIIAITQNVVRHKQKDLAKVF
jgi:hypothetical protein